MAGFLGVENDWGRWIAEQVYNFFNLQSSWGYWILLLAGGGVPFFYTLVIFQQQNIAENLQKQGGFIRGSAGTPYRGVPLSVLIRIMVGALSWDSSRSCRSWCSFLRRADAFRGDRAVDRGRCRTDTMRQLGMTLMRHYRGFIK